MFKSKTVVFITIDFAGIAETFDYPKHLPIPGIGDEVIFNGKFGKVELVRHMTEGTVTHISIKCGPF